MKGSVVRLLSCTVVLAVLAILTPDTVAQAGEPPSKDAGAILAPDQAKAIRLHFLRDLTKAQLVEAFREGFEAATPPSEDLRKGMLG